MTALVERHQMAVDPHARDVVDGAKMQQHASRSGAHMERAFIPATLMQPSIADPARLRFRRKRHDDLHGPFLDIRGMNILAVIVVKKFPCTVKRSPILPFHQWARIHWCQVFPPVYAKTRESDRPIAGRRTLDHPEWSVLRRPPKAACVQKHCLFVR